MGQSGKRSLGTTSQHIAINQKSRQANQWDIMARTFRFVRHEDISQFEQMGYVFSCYIKGHQGLWSVIMEKIDAEERVHRESDIIFRG